MQHRPAVIQTREIRQRLRAASVAGCKLQYPFETVKTHSRLAEGKRETYRVRWKFTHGVIIVPESSGGFHFSMEFTEGIGNEEGTDRDSRIHEGGTHTAKGDDIISSLQIVTIR